MPFFIKITAATKKIAVKALIVAYIGGRNVRGFAIGKFSTIIIGSIFGDLKSKMILSSVHFVKSKRATTSGTKIETITLSRLYILVLLFTQ